jgi:hypothetical protein
MHRNHSSSYIQKSINRYALFPLYALVLSCGKDDLHVPNSSAETAPPYLH